MYATVHQFRRSHADEPEGWGHALAAELHPGTGSPGTCTLAQIGGLTGLVVALWRDRGSALAAGDHRTPGTFDARVYEVSDVESGTAEPRIAQATWFDRPLTQAEADAADFGGRERIRPAVQGLGGIAGFYILTAEDRSRLVLGFTESIEAMEAVQKAVVSTELLPGEDPALLSGPDRIDVHRVLHTSLPAPGLVGEPR
ncbi:hypothetical protein DL990_12055 [Amycolatopsis sp. WAC 01416]|uniref:hypothetical protein n=1 Tax=Amycolatopsis sp. WAC 01416 TaxID=2203196 RepID=UPI000F771819|nr:hypothetical protein [Amycolatopsis sp. WAC 01416]RSN34399.1 hypothetical protein DL990_12055 [Amycolatopsis sp. WAC 01416]